MGPFLLLKGETPRIVSISHMCTSLYSGYCHPLLWVNSHPSCPNLDGSEFALSASLVSAMVCRSVCVFSHHTGALVHVCVSTHTCQFDCVLSHHTGALVHVRMLLHWLAWSYFDNPVSSRSPWFHTSLTSPGNTALMAPLIILISEECQSEDLERVDLVGVQQNGKKTKQKNLYRGVFRRK